MHALLLAALAAVAFPASTAVPFRTVLEGSGASSSVTQREGRVVRDRAAWTRLHARLTGDRGTAPRVDFSRHVLIAVTQGQRGTGGHRIRVTAVRRSGGRLMVDVRETSPGEGCIVTQAVTSPFHAVRVRRTAARVSYRRRQATRDC